MYRTALWSLDNLVVKVGYRIFGSGNLQFHPEVRRFPSFLDSGWRVSSHGEVPLGRRVTVRWFINKDEILVMTLTHIHKIFENIVKRFHYNTET